MSIPTLLQILTRKGPVAATRAQNKCNETSGKNPQPPLLPGRFRRKGDARTSYLNTGYLNNHVLKDIGLERSDLTKPG